MSNLTRAKVLATLEQVLEPNLEKDLVSLNLVKDLKIEGGNVIFSVHLTTPDTPTKKKIEESATAAVSRLDGVESVTITFENRVPSDLRLLGKMNIGVRNAIAVASGKGGVGKSTMSTNLALSLALDGAKVGLLDADLYGPNIPMMMGIDERPRGQNDKIIPPENYGVKLMSMGFLVPPDQAVIWRGPMIHNALRQFLQDVEWGDLDYLIVDLPPGTGDASLSLTQSLSLTGAVIVTTPQQVALSDVVRGVQMFEQLNVPILGAIENMSYFIAPDTGNRYDIFGHGGGAEMARKVGIDFLGEVPLEPEVRLGGDEGQPIVIRDETSAAAQAIREVARKIAASVSVKNLATAPTQSQSGPNIKILN
ncbi:MAG: Mrp/NBP35 family ATP-binding protein [Anaerolineae bacterium]|nr:Mrp/NBP35 family ATP-binding protein [Anaerolineae bacterium]